jgi:hypothetical protein
MIAPSARELEFPPIGNAIRHSEVKIGRRAVDFYVQVILNIKIYALFTQRKDYSSPK